MVSMATRKLMKMLGVCGRRFHDHARLVWGKLLTASRWQAQDQRRIEKPDLMTRKIESNQPSYASVIVEIVGLSGAGKTTLAEQLPDFFAKSNAHAIHSKTQPAAGFSLRVKAAGALLAIKDVVRLSPYFLRPFIDGDQRLGLSGFRRLLKSFRHAMPRRVLPLALPCNTVIVQEPGWPMELLSHYLYSRRPLTDADARRFLNAAPPIDYLIILTAEPQISVARMKGRPRGIPKGLRHLNADELHEWLERGNITSAVLDYAGRAVGIKTLKLDVSKLEANEVAQHVTKFIVERLATQQNRNDPAV